MLSINNNKENFLILAKDNIHREGINNLLNYLEQTDFFEAPCSTKYHLCCRGGLCQHSLNVYEMLINLADINNIRINDNIESLTISALFHDICKVNFYSQELKMVKENNHWIQKPTYVINEDLPLGHGEKSVIIIQKFMNLTDEEMCAIRWHMGGFDSAIKGGDLSYDCAIKKYGLVTLLQCADMISSNIIEKGD